MRNVELLYRGCCIASGTMEEVECQKRLFLLLHLSDFGYHSVAFVRSFIYVFGVFHVPSFLLFFPYDPPIYWYLD